MSERQLARTMAGVGLRPSLTPAHRGMLQRKCACGGTPGPTGECEACRSKRESESLPRTYDHPSFSGPHPFEVPPIVGEVLRAAGKPLDSETRAFMEPRFGQDFSSVRVHTDARAAASAQAVDALAYTVGSELVFGTGLYQSVTNEGRRLLAHELAHVVQQRQQGGSVAPPTKYKIVSPGDASEQEADMVAQRITETTIAPGKPVGHTQQQGLPAGILQRTPAPPTYGGVTGTRDLSKLRIDPVPDLDKSKFTAPLDVHAHVLDPAIAHFTWMLYDPKDNMIAGFSTLPKKSNSTTMAFTLKPSHFAGVGFVEGKYLLRCSGLNAKHQPIVFADRDVTVVKADLTTGIDLATPHGKLTFTKYGKTDANPPATPNWKVDVEIKFMPDKKVPCNDVTYIQALESVDATGKSNQGFTSADQEARQTPLTWSIDRVAGAPSPFYIMGKNTSGRVVDVAGWGKAGKGGATPGKATLIDVPQWNKATNDKFETCVMCRSGGHKGEVYGCATWGYTADASGKVTLQPRRFNQTPSDQFKEARDAWNTWRATVAAATRPREAPVLKTP
jgi:hypothetical protein